MIRDSRARYEKQGVGVRSKGLYTSMSLLCMLASAACFDLPVEPPTSGFIISITNPVDGSTVGQRTVDITGRIAPSPQQGIVRVRAIKGMIQDDGAFSITVVPLLELDTTLTVEFVVDDAVVATNSVTVRYSPEDRASKFVEASVGGRIAIEDPMNSAHGAAIVFPPGALGRDALASLLADPEHAPQVPRHFVAVGPPIVFGPEGEDFLGDAILTVPVRPELMPAERSEADIKVLGFREDRWVELVPDGVTAHDATVSIAASDMGPFIPVVPIVLEMGQALISSLPAFATIYLDGLDTGLRTPAVLSAISDGEHEVKVYLPGFNEAFVPLSIHGDQGSVLLVDLGRPTDPVPVVQLDPDLHDGVVVPSSFVDVGATVTLEGQPLDAGIAVLSVNGNDSFATISDGRVNGAVVLQDGLNVVQVRANGPDGSTGESNTITVTRNAAAARIRSPQPSPPTAEALAKLEELELELPHLPVFDQYSMDGSANWGRVFRVNNGQDIQIRLSWNTDRTDLDLHTFDPAGQHAWYGSLRGIPGGALDRDDVNGFGPEVFSLPNPPPGEYRVAVNSYRIDGIPTTGVVEIIVGGESIFSDSYLFTTSDRNQTRGQPEGASPSAFWDTHTFEIGTLEIVSIRTAQQSPRTNAIFTTASGENSISVDIDAPASVSESQIMLEVVEVHENFVVNTSGLSGRQITFDADHRPLMGLTIPRYSRPIEYEITAFTADAQGARQLESNSQRLRQDVRSQIRQEYVDKRNLRAEFVRPTPNRSEIIDASGFNRQPGEKFGFGEFSRYSDFGPGLAVISDSRGIANTIRQAWGYPLLITSGWRNPRCNDALSDSDINSYHQTGNAIDLNPSRLRQNWPVNCPCCGAGIQSYADAQAALTCVAKNTLNLGIYDVLFHANHLHIERDPSGNPNS